MEQAIAVGYSSSTRKALAALFFGMFVAGVGNSFVFAVLPPVGRELGLSEIQIGSVVTVSSIFFTLGSLYWGGKSEQWGRRPVLLFGMSSYFILSMMFAGVIQLGLSGIITAALAYPLMLIARGLFTACISGIFPTSQAYIADVTPLEDRARGMAMFGVVMGLGFTVGPAVAAAFVGFGLVTPFVAVASLSIVAGFLFKAYVVEPPKHAANDGGTGEPLPFLDALPFYAVSMLTICTMSTVQQASGFYYQDKFGLSAAETTRFVGLALMVSAGASVLSQLVLIMRFRMAPRALLRAGVPIALAGIVVLIAADAYALLVVGMGILGTGFGMINPGNMAALSIRAQGHGFGKIAGINTAATSVGFGAGPMISSVLYQEVDHLAPFYAALGLLMALFFLVYRVVKIPTI